MFTKIIGKKCTCPPADCSLSGQLQDSGLSICPQCGNDLVLEKVENKRARALVMAALALVGALLGMSGYGWISRGLSPIRTAQWLLNLIEIGDTFHPAEATTWVDGGIMFYNETGALPRSEKLFLYERKDGRHTSTFREPLKSNTTMKFNLTSVAPSVSSLYVLYRGDKDGRVLFAADQPPGPSLRAPLVIPGKDKLIRLDSGAAIEHFVLIAAKKPLPSLITLVSKAEPPQGQTEPVLVSTGDVDAAVAPVEHDPDVYVLHVFIPHS